MILKGAKMVLNYLNTLKNKGDFTYESISKMSGVPEATVKNIFSGKTEDPRFETVSAIVIAMGGSLDEMLTPHKSKDEFKENSVNAIKDIYEFQLDSMREHYKREITELKNNYEHRLADKREIIESEKERTKSAEKSSLHKTIIIGFLVAIYITLFIMELMHPEHGWLRY